MKKSSTTQPTNAIDEYLASVPEPARTTLTGLRTTIRSVVPEDTIETIAYGIPTFKLKQNVVHFAAFAKHCSFFPTPSIIEMFRDELKNYKISKGTIQFPVDQPLSDALVKNMVKARLAQIAAKSPR
jgi:uncharacterized protein YdhG (YjbR/CyaY superfamily)